MKSWREKLKLKSALAGGLAGREDCPVTDGVGFGMGESGYLQVCGVRTASSTQQDRQCFRFTQLRKHAGHVSTGAWKTSLAPVEREPQTPQGCASS